MSDLTKVLNLVLAYLHRYGNGSPEACNLWEEVHALQGCKECIALLERRSKR